MKIQVLIQVLDQNVVFNSEHGLSIQALPIFSIDVVLLRALYLPNEYITTPLQVSMVKAKLEAFSQKAV